MANKDGKLQMVNVEVDHTKSLGLAVIPRRRRRRRRSKELIMVFNKVEN